MPSLINLYKSIPESMLPCFGSEDSGMFYDTAEQFAERLICFFMSPETPMQRRISVPCLIQEAEYFLPILDQHV